MIILHHDFSSHLSHKHFWSIENTTYLTPMSLVRLLLLLPLMYHTYSGNRLRLPKLYMSFHVCSAVVVSCHFLAFSICAIDDAISNTTSHKIDDSKEVDIIWTLLMLSLISITSHIVILFHVRSTAPTNDAITRKFEGAQRVNSNSVGKTRKMLAYWIYDRYRRGNHSFNNSMHLPATEPREEDVVVHSDHSLNNVDSDGLEGFNLSSRPSFEYRDEIGLGFRDERGYSQLRRRENGRTIDHGVNLGNIVGSLSEGYDEFWSEIRYRFQEAKKEWTLRLDEVKLRVRQQNDHIGNSHNIFHHVNTSNTPFRALLQMYAHEEVFQNKILDRAFPIQGDKLALSFYAPQLLCFLLHNAYLSTGKLERWILERCKSDLQFAHRCFWFLRSWCLQGGIFRLEEYHNDGQSEIHRVDSVENSISSLHSLKQDMLEEGHLDRSFSAPDLSNIRDLVQDPTKKELEKSHGMKFHSEERKSLEKLLGKIVSNGECAARQVETCNVNGSSSGNGRMSGVQEEGLEITQTLFRSDSSLRLDVDGREVRSCFLRSPDFLDSLLAIADDLLLLGPSQRTFELRKRLKELDSKMLPSNTIYLPVNNSLHQVWSIAESESIALSTKERVPCIIYLEVINHFTSSVTEHDQDLRNWYTSDRPPQRLNTILDKMSNFTQKGLQKLQHDFEKNQEKIFGSRSIELDDSESLSLLSEQSAIVPDIESPFTPRTTNHGSLQKESLGQWLSPDHRKLSRDSLSDSDESYGSTGFPGSNMESDEENAASMSMTSQSLPIVFKENFNAKQERLRKQSFQGSNPNWRLLPILIKSNDDLRQEQLASQLIHCMATILSRAKVPVWLYPYEIVALSFRGGIMEAIPDTISIDSLRKNYPHFTDLKHFYKDHFGEPGSDNYENAKANFMESLAAYSIICFIMQIKDRHNGNILIDNKGHLIHIDFGFFFLSSPGKNSGFESAPFKLTKDFVDLIGGSHSHSFHRFRNLCYRTFLELRKNCFEITLLVQMLTEGNEDLGCFRGRPHDAIRGMQERFRLDLSDKACHEYVNCLIDESIENWTTTCYDRYQRCFVGVM